MTTNAWQTVVVRDNVTTNAWQTVVVRIQMEPKRGPYNMHLILGGPEPTSSRNSRLRKRSNSQVQAQMNDDHSDIPLSEEDNQRIMEEDNESDFHELNVPENVIRLTGSMYQGPILQGSLDWKECNEGKKYQVLICLYNSF